MVWEQSAEKSRSQSGENEERKKGGQMFGRISFTLGALVLFLSACTNSEQLRTEVANEDGSPRVCKYSADGETPVCGEGKYAIELRHYKQPKEGMPESTATDEPSYLFSVVEFDEQGWIWDRRQIEALMTELWKLQKAKKEVLIVVFAHGWKHNAGQCDSNVICFQRILERFDVMERKLRAIEPEEDSEPRTIVGVYIGWRGLSTTVEPLKTLSFWERKNTAHRVGLGGVTELLVRLDEYRDMRNQKDVAGGTQLMVSGHSFGGKVIYSAISQIMLERAIKMGDECRQNGHGCSKYDYPEANGFGDFVVLINPAFEGAMYEPLYSAATNRCYPQGQKPVMMVVTSSADNATREIFPLGRSVSTMWETVQSRPGLNQNDAILQTVGHLPRYRTHNLELVTKKKEKGMAQTASTDKGGRAAETGGRSKKGHTGEAGNCGCEYLGATADFDVDKENRFIAQLHADAEKHKGRVSPDETSDGVYKYGTEKDGTGLVLKAVNGERTFSPNFPYLVVYTDETLIADHNAIYSEDFTDFLRRFMVRHISRGTKFEPRCYPENGVLPYCDSTGPNACKQSCFFNNKALDGGGTSDQLASCSNRLPQLNGD